MQSHSTQTILGITALMNSYKETVVYAQRTVPGTIGLSITAE